MRARILAKFYLFVMLTAPVWGFGLAYSRLISRRRSGSMVEKLRFSIWIGIHCAWGAQGFDFAEIVSFFLLRGGRTRTLMPSPCESRHRGKPLDPRGDAVYSVQL